MPPPRISDGLLRQLRSLAISTPSCSVSRPAAIHSNPINRAATKSIQLRTFTSTRTNHDWLLPKVGAGTRKTHKGRPRVHTGGSTRGTTVVWGDYGLRMRDHHRRISAAQLKLGEETIKRRLRGTNYRLYRRVAANIAVYKKGNESRMGTGKGGFDHWAVRLGVNKIVFELKGNVHEQVVRDAFRLAGNKLPGQWEFVRRGDPAVMGVTKLTGDVDLNELMSPRLKVPEPSPASTAERLPATTPV